MREGGYLLYDSSWPLDQDLVREDVTVLGVPFGQLCVENFEGDRARTLLRNIVYTGTLAALFDIDMETGSLVKQAPPNDGILNTVGVLGAKATSVAFDIWSDGTSADDLIRQILKAVPRPEKVLQSHVHVA